MAKEAKLPLTPSLPQDGNIFVYAVVDLAILIQARPFIRSLPPAAAEPLLSRSLSWRLLEVGPWLVRLSRAPDLESLLANIPSGVPWGYYIYSSVDIVSLRHSLRKFNLVIVAGSSKPVLFRYWDPRVMATFLKIASAPQREKFHEWIVKISSPDGQF